MRLCCDKCSSSLPTRVWFKQIGLQKVSPKSLGKHTFSATLKSRGSHLFTIDTKFVNMKTLAIQLSVV